MITETPTIKKQVIEFFRQNRGEYSAGEIAKAIGCYDSTVKKEICLLRKEHGEGYIKGRPEKNEAGTGSYELYRAGTIKPEHPRHSEYHKIMSGYPDGHPEQTKILEQLGEI